MKKDLVVGWGGRWVNTVVMRFNGGGVNKKGWEQSIWSSSVCRRLKLEGITRTHLCTSAM